MLAAIQNAIAFIFFSFVFCEGWLHADLFSVDLKLICCSSLFHQLIHPQLIHNGNHSINISSLHGQLSMWLIASNSKSDLVYVMLCGLVSLYKTQYLLICGQRAD